MRNTRSKKESRQRRRRTMEERAEVVGRYVESGQTQRVFAHGEGIGVSTLQLWLRQVSAAAEAGRGQSSRDRRGSSSAVEPISLLEVELEEPRSEASRREAAGYEMELRCGTRLRVGTGFVESDVRRLLALLKEVMN